MIEFIEDEPTRLKFVSRPYTKLISYSALLIISLPLVYWTVFIAPASSTLSCQRSSNQIDCLLQEKSLIRLPLCDLKISNVVKLDRYIFGLSDSKHITLITSSNSARFNLFNSQKKYKYPSKSTNLLTMNPKFGFDLMNQRKQLKQFINGELAQQALNLKVQLDWFVIFIIAALAVPFAAIYWIINSPFKTEYDFDGENQKLTISVHSILNSEEKSYGFDRIQGVIINKESLDLGGRIMLQLIPEYKYSIEEYLDEEYGESVWQKINDLIARYK